MRNLKLLPIALVLVFASAAYAQPKAGAPAPEAKKAPDASKPAPPAPTPTPTPVAPKPEGPPKPAQEFTDMAKGMAGTWKCAGQAEIKGEMKDVKATITHKADLNGFWVKSDFTGTAAKMPPMKFTMYTSYDATTKKLWRVSVTGLGTHSTMVGTMADKKVTWEGDAHWMVGDVKVRASDEMVSAKEVKVMGEYSKDGGKTWNKDHEATCKK